jgi:alkylation response protein AidB-like acyl-CoA dehydrogenase
MQILGPRAELLRSAPHVSADGRWLHDYLFSLAGPIYAGTNEIQRNIVARRVLELPR